MQCRKILCLSFQVGILVLSGWRLNVLESVAVTTAIGLSVDFSLHYAVHYRQSEEELREPSVVHALTRMTGPTAMGAITTGVAGAFMLLSSVLPYIQVSVPEPKTVSLRRYLYIAPCLSKTYLYKL